MVLRTGFLRTKPHDHHPPDKRPVKSSLINSEPSWLAYVTNLRALYEDKHYITCPAPRIGEDRSLDQNALFHVWIREFASHLFSKVETEITDAELAGTKRAVKMGFHKEFNEERWMVHKVPNPLHPDMTIFRWDYTSSAKWKTGEMFMVLDWFQMFAAQRGCVLESTGAFAKLKRDQSV